MLIKVQGPPSNFMTKGPGRAGMVSGFMGKLPGIIRGVTLQPHPAMTGAKPVNTLERK